MCTCGGVGGVGSVRGVGGLGGLGGCISGGGKGEQQFCIVVQAEKEAEPQSRGEDLVEIQTKFPRVGWKFGGNFNQTSMGGVEVCMEVLKAFSKYIYCCTQWFQGLCVEVWVEVCQNFQWKFGRNFHQISTPACVRIIRFHPD